MELPVSIVAADHEFKSRLRALVRPKAIPAWLLVGWNLVGHASTFDFIRETWAWAAPLMIPFFKEHADVIAPVFGIAWLTWLVLRTPRTSSNESSRQPEVRTVDQLRHEAEDVPQLDGTAQKREQEFREERARADDLQWKLTSTIEERESFRSALLSVEMTIKTLTDEHAKAIQDLEDRTHGLEAQVRQSDYRRDELWWELRYGGEPPSMPELSELDARLMRSRMEEFMPILSAAVEGSEPVVLHLLEQHFAADDSETMGFFLAAFVRERVVDRALFAFGHLRDSVQSRRDPRASLIGFYGRYQSLRHWIFRCLALLRVSPHVVPSYAQWLADDKTFHQELGRMLRNSYLEVVRRQIENDNASHNYPTPYPD